jgi:hypothetical protein
VQRLDHFQPVAVFQPQIDHGIGGRAGNRLGPAFGDTLRSLWQKTTFFHGLGKAFHEGFVVIDQQQRAVRAKVGVEVFGHASVLLFQRASRRSFARPDKTSNAFRHLIGCNLAAEEIHNAGAGHHQMGEGRMVHQVDFVRGIALCAEGRAGR